MLNETGHEGDGPSHHRGLAKASVKQLDAQTSRGRVCRSADADRVRLLGLVSVSVPVGRFPGVDIEAETAQAGVDDGREGEMSLVLILNTTVVGVKSHFSTLT